MDFIPGHGCIDKINLAATNDRKEHDITGKKPTNRLTIKRRLGKGTLMMDNLVCKHGTNNTSVIWVGCRYNLNQGCRLQINTEYNKINQYQYSMIERTCLS